jgi:hypothetical protein
MRWIEDFDGKRNNLTPLHHAFPKLPPSYSVAIWFNLNRLLGEFASQDRLDYREEFQNGAQVINSDSDEHS